MIWKSKTQGEDKIIAFIDNIIYKGNPKDDQLEKIILELKNHKPSSNLIGIPLSHIKEINLEDGKNYIEVLFGMDSTEHLRIKDRERRDEIFGFLKSNVPNSKNHIEKYSKIKAGKKPLFAIAIFLPLFLWTFYIANEIEKGYQYEIVGRGNSISGIVLAIASLGVTKVSIIFGSILGIAILGFIQKTRNPKIIDQIKIIRANS